VVHLGVILEKMRSTLRHLCSRVITAVEVLCTVEQRVMYRTGNRLLPIFRFTYTRFLVGTDLKLTYIDIQKGEL
jgi:hypothetical protein